MAITEGRELVGALELLVVMVHLVLRHKAVERVSLRRVMHLLGCERDEGHVSLEGPEALRRNVREGV